MSLLTELKRRNVIRVSLAYLIVAWLLLQVADVMIDNIGAPDWLFGSILLVLGIGFPVVLVFAALGVGFALPLSVLSAWPRWRGSTQTSATTNSPRSGGGRSDSRRCCRRCGSGSMRCGWL